MKLSHPVLQKHDQKAHRLLDRRSAERVPIRFQISHSGLKGARIVTGEGTLKDLSKTGCKIWGVAPSSLGSSMTLVLYLEEGQAPLCLTEVTISWIDSDSFAVRFPRLSAEERRRLQDVICRNVSVSSLDDRRTAFRFI